LSANATEPHMSF